MHAMVDNLLMLARAESHQLVNTREPMDLADLCRETWAHFQPRAYERKLEVEWRIPTDCVVNSDQEKIRLLLNNFFDNAVSYTNTGGRITITISRTPKARLQVSNTGSIDRRTINLVTLHAQTTVTLTPAATPAPAIGPTARVGVI